MQPHAITGNIIGIHIGADHIVLDHQAHQFSDSWNTPGVDSIVGPGYLVIFNKDIIIIRTGT